MTALQIEKKLAQGYKFEVWIKPTKKHDKVTLKTLLINRETGFLNEVYFNHVKKFLTTEQIRIKTLFDKVKKMSFAEFVELNIRKHKNTLTRLDIEILTIKESINKITSLELI